MGRPPRYTPGVRRGEPARRHERLSPWRKAIEELPHGLIDRLRRGQPEARAELFRLYAPQVRRILYLQGFCEEVDDAVQEVFIKVFRAEVPREEVFLAWFYRVILNTGRDHGRRRKTKYGLMDKLQQITPEATVDPPSDPADPALRDALATLPDELRECVALRFFADLPLDEIAKAQDIPVGTVKSRLHGAVKKLKLALEEGGYVRES
jgi:RNA polymerase sigma-70 factor, ECF subfamily